MSAPLAGKFQDHYKVLGVDPRSDKDAIQSAWTALSMQYNPANPGGGDPEKFESVNLAWEILSDSDLRKEFDKLKGIGEEKDGPKFSGPVFFDALGQDTGLRTAVLCVLYDRRRNRPFTPSLSMRHIENILISTQESLNLTVWYLKQRNLAISDDKSSLQITVDGIDFLEKSRPSPESVMPYIKPTGLAGSVAAAMPVAQAVTPALEPVPATPALEALAEAVADSSPAATEPVPAATNDPGSQAHSIARLRNMLAPR